MEKFEPMCPWHIQIGDLFIAPGKVPNQGTVFIGEVDGSGGKEIPTEQLEDLLYRFYDEVC